MAVTATRFGEEHTKQGVTRSRRDGIAQGAAVALSELMQRRLTTYLYHVTL